MATFAPGFVVGYGRVRAGYGRVVVCRLEDFMLWVGIVIGVFLGWFLLYGLLALIEWWERPLLDDSGDSL